MLCECCRPAAPAPAPAAATSDAHRGPLRPLPQLAPEGQFYNYSGCGNTVNCNHPVVRQFIVDCLRYWVRLRLRLRLCLRQPCVRALRKAGSTP